MDVSGMKAFRIDDKGKICFLFHGFRGSKVVPLDRWIETKRPWVQNPGKKLQGKSFRAAFHFFREPERVEAFRRLTGDNYVIIPIKARRVEPKPRTNMGSWLAEKIFVSSADVEKVRIGRKAPADV
jgi:hypothetical protein